MADKLPFTARNPLRGVLLIILGALLLVSGIREQLHDASTKEEAACGITGD